IARRFLKIAPDVDFDRADPCHRAPAVMQSTQRVVMAGPVIARPRKSPPRRSASSQPGLVCWSLWWNAGSRFWRPPLALRTQSPLAAHQRGAAAHSGPPILIFVVVLQRRARIAAALASRHHLNGFEIIREGCPVISDCSPEKSVSRPIPPSPPLAQSSNRFI